MRLRIAHKWGSGFRDNTPFLTFTLAVKGSSAKVMQVGVPFSVAEELAPGCDKDPSPLTDPLMLLLLDRLSHMGEDGMAPLLHNVVGKPTYVFEMDEGDLPHVRRLAAEKSCKYQKPVKGDLSCTVATTMQSLEAVEMATTRHLCRVCPVPDDRLACSNFSHARVFQQPGGRSIELRHALCERGQGEIDLDRTACRPGGYECWEREVEFEQPSDESEHALALHELFEFVDARWKAAFQNHLISSRRGMAFGKLSTPCATSADIEAKLSALAHVMKGFEVPDELLKEEHRERDEYKAGHSLNRTESALERKLADDTATVTTAKRAIAVLRDANGLRNAAQHGGSEVVARYARFRLPYPPPPAPETWARIQSRVAQALHDLAGAIPDE